jgi:predicted GH43/DUF377 family glycosyl hydrolase
MDRIYICLGKFGDILSILPILRDEYERTKIRPKLLVARDYAALLAGFSYLEPLIYSGPFGDLAGAIRSVKSNGNEAVPLQVYGDGFPFQKRAPSFQLDQWLRAGAVEHFYEWLLLVDRRNRHREEMLVKQVARKKPMILFADYSESAPFRQRDALASSLNTRFGDSHDVIRLSSVRAQHFCDFVGLYNRSSVLLTTDTSHLHLSSASATPVIALARNVPLRWHGAAWHPRMAFYCRYSDFERRQDELLWEVDRVINRCGAPIEGEKVKTLARDGYNPTIVEGDNLMVYRYHPGSDWRTVLVAEVGEESAVIGFPEDFSGQSTEDARLFTFRGNTFISFVLAREEFSTWKSVVGYAELLRTESGWKIDKPLFPKFGQNNWGAMEKNWVFFEHDRKLMFIYSSSPEQIVVEVDGETPHGTHVTPSPKWNYGEIRGGCLVRHGENYLRFFHSHTTEGNRDGWVYSIGAALMESKPPFRTLAVSKLPVLAGNEKWKQDCRHWKANVVFPAGVARHENGWKLAYGANDCECMVAYLGEKDLNL